MRNKLGVEIFCDPSFYFFLYQDPINHIELRYSFDFNIMDQNANDMGEKILNNNWVSRHPSIRFKKGGF